MELLSEMDFESIHLPTEIREKLDKIKDRQQPAGVSVEPH